MNDTLHPMPGAWHWWATTDEENFQIGPCTTREAVIAQALGDEIGAYDATDGKVDEEGNSVAPEWRCSFHIAEAKDYNIDLARFFDLEQWFEWASESMDDNNCGSDDDGEWHPLDEISQEQKANLDAAIKATIRNWQKHHALPLRSYWFAQTRNEEPIDLPLEG